MLKLLLILMPFIFIQAHAVELDTNYLTFNIAERNINPEHFERSAAANYKFLGTESSIPTFSLRVGLEKEIFENKPISFTLGGGVGVMFGRSKYENVSSDLRQVDRVKGTLYSAGGTVNTNFMWQKMRTQFFGGLNIVKTKTKYQLMHTPFSSDRPQTNIDYEEDGTQSFATAGMRFFNTKLGLFSIFSIEYQVASTFTNHLTAAKMDGANIIIENSSTEIEHQPLVLNVGFGIAF